MSLKMETFGVCDRVPLHKSLNILEPEFLQL